MFCIFCVSRLRNIQYICFYKLQVKRRILYKLFLVVFAGITIASCIKKPKYRSEPVIEYKDFLRYGDPSDPDSVELVISFTDNEGDIGIEQGDTNNSIFKSGNLFMVYYYDSNGTWTAFDPNPAAPFDTMIIPYRVPVALQEGDDSEPMKGLIYVKQKFPFKWATHTKLMYRVHMYDKALHKSNTIDTPPIEF